MSNRLNQLMEWLKTEAYEMVFLHSSDNVFYVSNFNTDPHERLLGVFAFPEAEPFLICPAMEVQQAKASGWTGEIIGYQDHENPWLFVERSIRKRGLSKIRSIAIEKDRLSYNRAERIVQMFPGAKLYSAEGKMSQLRSIKEPSEIQTLKQAAQLADYGIDVGVSALKAGVSELDVLAAIEYELKRKGVREMSFSTTILFGEKSADPHGKSGLRHLKEGDFCLFDLGVVLDGYCSDITRTVLFGRGSGEQHQIYNTVLRAQLAALDASNPGTRIGDIDIAGRKVIENAGYGEFFTHRIGHGIGISVHEFPSINKENNEVVKKGMVYTIEPGIYLPGIGGVRIEDEVVITESGFETLTNWPKELVVIK